MPNQTLSFLKRRFQEVGLELNPRHGQNFLIDLNLVRLLVETAQLTPDDVVLEVGTGTGSLTALMAAEAGHVVTVEIDPRLFQLASEELIDVPNVTMLRLDALAGKHTIAPELLAAIDEQLAAAPRRQFKLAANLPYGVATPLISNLLLLARPPATMTVTIQKELADRITAVPGSKDYSALSFWVQCQCRAEVVRSMPPSVFWPRPKVNSAILQLTLEPARRAAIPDLAFFHDFVRSLFLHRRKFLRGVLVAAFKDRLDKPAIDEIRGELQLAENARAEELSIDEMLALCAAVKRRLESASCNGGCH